MPQRPPYRRYFLIDAFVKIYREAVYMWLSSLIYSTDLPFLVSGTMLGMARLSDSPHCSAVTYSHNSSAFEHLWLCRHPVSFPSPCGPALCLRWLVPTYLPWLWWRFLGPLLPDSVFVEGISHRPALVSSCCTSRPLATQLFVHIRHFPPPCPG